MTRAASGMWKKAAEVRVLEAARLDAAASAIWPKVLEGKLRAHETCLRNRTGYSSHLGLDARQEPVTLVDNRTVNSVLSPPWEREAGAGSG